MQSPQPWRATVLSLFPAMLPGPLALSLAGRALQRQLWRLDIIDIRASATDRRQSVDDRPAGGGPGMVMRPDVLAAALNRAAPDGRPAYCLSPRGRLFSQADARQLAASDGVVLLCGRYQGVDQRFLDQAGLEELSIGDYVLSGGEPAALVVLDACIRLLPGVVGDSASTARESHSEGLLEYPQYTAPRLWRGASLPDVLLSGDHRRIKAWRRSAAEALTRRRRPDLWRRRQASLQSPE